MSQAFVEEFERRIGRSLKTREKGVLAELSQRLEDEVAELKSQTGGEG